MGAKHQGIYFKQTDQNKTGYYTKDINGDLVHHKYKKPSFWERAKYFATYGYEMNMNTIVTSYFYFSPTNTQVAFGSIVGDAISIARDFREKGNFGRWHSYEIKRDKLYFETDLIIFSLDFHDNGTSLKAITINKKNQSKSVEVYQYIDWNKI